LRNRQRNFPPMIGLSINSQTSSKSHGSEMN
jgi:hypothetical protein